MPILEQASKTMVGVAESFRNNPSCLAAIILAGLFAILSHLSLLNEREDMQKRQMALIERCPFPTSQADNRHP